MPMGLEFAQGAGDIPVLTTGPKSPYQSNSVSTSRFPKNIRRPPFMPLLSINKEGLLLYPIS